jgi:hypothetical protein
VAIWRLSKENACYKMMFVMGVLDMLALPICAIGTGILGIMGAVYCTWPGPIYVLGCLANGISLTDFGFIFGLHIASGKSEKSGFRICDGIDRIYIL